MIDRVVQVTEEAGRIVEGVRRDGLGVEEKAGGEPVTRADRAADRFLQRELRALAPAGWLSEEAADEPSRLERDRVWIVDPIDGTRELIRGVPEYSVSVALVESGRPVLAVVRNPATGETFHAVRGEGAFRNGSRIGVREGSILLASRTEAAADEFESFAPDWEVRPCGSIAYKLALVAAGDASGTLSRGPKREWDVCAGSLLVEEAGGTVTDGRGDPFRFNRRPPRTDGLVAGAPGVHARLLAEVRTLGMVDRSG
jgi:myo-inositol-1(or 4)-monophosphatase